MAAHPDLSKVDASGAADVFAGTQYRVISRIGRGGMGEVSHVVHEGITRGLAAKVLYRQFAGDAQLLERVRIEAQVLGSLRHDNVVDVTDYATSAGHSGSVPGSTMIGTSFDSRSRTDYAPDQPLSREGLNP